MKRIVLLFTFAFSLHILFAAVPLKWTVETSRVQPVAFDAVHGETLALQASFNTYGTPLQMASNAALFYQTNGMGSAWWTAAASVSSNVVAATFTPSMDPGAQVVYGFLGTTGENYRAAFTLRFRKGPGATPNVIDMPPRILDLAHTVVINPPWPTDETIDTRIRTVIEEDDITAKMPTNTVTGIISNTVTKAYVEDLGITGGGGGGGSGVSTNAVSGIITNHVDSGYLCTVAAAKAYADEHFISSKTFDRQEIRGPLTILDSLTCDYISGSSIDASVEITVGNTWMNCVEGIGTTLDIRKDGENVVYGISTNGAPALHGDVKIETVSKAETDAAYFPKTEGAAWSRYWGGDDFVVTITNYPTERGATRSPSGKMPHLFMSWKTSDDDGEYQQIVWDEEWWQNWLLNTYLPTNFLTKAETLAALDEKADRAWGFYDSHTGLLAPDGYTQISSSNIMIAAGMGYQKTVTTEGEVWVLTADSTDVQLAPTTGGQFRISDSDGNSVFEIVKGDKRTVGASPGATAIIGAYAITHLQIHYYIDSDAHPTLQISNDLSTWAEEGTDDCLANVDWDGAKGDWVAVVYGKTAQSKLFVKGSYEVGGETYIKNTAPVSMEYIYLGGVKYKLGTAVISGNTVLTLTAQ